MGVGGWGWVGEVRFMGVGGAGGGGEDLWGWVGGGGWGRRCVSAVGLVFVECKPGTTASAATRVTANKQLAIAQEPSQEHPGKVLRGWEAWVR